jgi:hypothetical protein
MNMRIHQFVTCLAPQEAYALIEILDQLRDTLVQSYGDDINATLHELGVPQQIAFTFDSDELPF